MCLFIFILFSAPPKKPTKMVITDDEDSGEDIMFIVNQCANNK